jgi:hypothetical protein
MRTRGTGRHAVRGGVAQGSATHEAVRLQRGAARTTRSQRGYCKQVPMTEETIPLPEDPCASSATAPYPPPHTAPTPRYTHPPPLRAEQLRGLQVCGGARPQGVFCLLASRARLRATARRRSRVCLFVCCAAACHACRQVAHEHYGMDYIVFRPHNVYAVPSRRGYLHYSGKLPMRAVRGYSSMLPFRQKMQTRCQDSTAQHSTARCNAATGRCNAAECRSCNKAGRHVGARQARWPAAGTAQTRT